MIQRDFEMTELDKILEMWSADCQINTMKLDETSAETPMLHQKYLSLMASTKLKIKRIENEQKSLLHKKWLWYQGKMSQSEIEALGWEYDPLHGKKILKGEYEYYYNSDSDIQQSEEMLTYWKTVKETLEEIINTLRWRHSTIKNIIDFKRFESGN